MNTCLKTDLHCHFEGALNPRIAWENIQQLGKKLPRRINGVIDKHTACASFDDYRELITVADKAQDLLDFTGSYFHYLTMGITNTDDIKRFAADIFSKAEQDLSLLELSVFPAYISRRAKCSEKEALCAVADGLNESVKNMKAGIIYCTVSESLAGREHADFIINMRNILNTEKNVSLCGVDIGDFDMDYFNEDLFLVIRDNIKYLKDNGLRIKCHAGEARIEQNGDNLKAFPQKRALPERMSAAVKLGVERIGHGLSAADSPELLELIKEKDIHLELCPVSNYKTNIYEDYWSGYPVKKLVESGCSVSINSDDLSIQGSTWSDDYTWAQDTFGLSRAQIKFCIGEAHRKSFMNH